MDQKKFVQYLTTLNATFKERKTLGVISFVIQEGRVEIRSDGEITEGQMMEIANIMKIQSDAYIEFVSKNLNEEKKQSQVH